MCHPLIITGNVYASQIVVAKVTFNTKKLSLVYELTFKLFNFDTRFTDFDLQTVARRPLLPQLRQS